MKKKIINFDAFQGININSVTKLLPIFFVEMKKDADILKVEIEDRDLENINKSLHKMSGSSKSYGTEEMLETLNKIREIIKDKEATQLAINLLNNSVLKIQKHLEEELKITLN